MAIKKIAVLTSGGDAPGMNAGVRAVTRTALERGVEVVGVYRGYNGLIEGDIKPLNRRSVSDILHRGGTVLYTARSPEFCTEAGMKKAVETFHKNHIDALVVMGGDGSFRGALDLSRHGIPCMGIPCTIDNDIACCEQTIGYDTALNTSMEMIDKLRDTSQSHDRCSVVEVMGRHAGHLALNVGIAVGATAILVPEVPFDFQTHVVERMKSALATGKKHFIIVVAEGVGHAVELASKIEEATGVESRATILGHVQRGGNPTVRDRVLSSRMAHHAVDLLLNGNANRVITVHRDQIVDLGIEDALALPKKPFDLQLYHMAHEISN